MYAWGRMNKAEGLADGRARCAARADDVLVLDRGYPAWWLFAALQARKLNFCARIDACGWPDVARLLRSSARELC